MAGVSAARAYHTVSGFFYCLLPVALFVLMWRITRAPGSAFADVERYVAALDATPGPADFRCAGVFRSLARSSPGDS